VVQFKPRKIPGRWRDGYALDLQTVSSSYIGDDEYGHPRFDTKRSEVGELLYRLKYRADRSAVSELVGAAVTFLESWKPGIEIVVPVPASRMRTMQPVMVIADMLAQRLGITLADCVKRTRDISELKYVTEYDERIRLLAGIHSVDAAVVKGKRVLLFDDLFRSGATMNAITVELYDKGGVADVFALTITQSRSRQ
jgi:competence protein ComFC